jgi:hypothetical protein
VLFFLNLNGAFRGLTQKIQQYKLSIEMEKYLKKGDERTAEFLCGLDSDTVAEVSKLNTQQANSFNGKWVLKDIQCGERGLSQNGKAFLKDLKSSIVKVSLSISNQSVFTKTVIKKDWDKTCIRCQYSKWAFDQENLRIFSQTTSSENISIGQVACDDQIERGFIFEKKLALIGNQLHLTLVGDNSYSFYCEGQTNIYERIL